MSLYKTPFSPGYWREALGAFGKLRILIFAAFLVALEVVVSMFSIRLGSEALQMQFTFLVVSCSSLVCGPLVSLVSSCAADLLSFFLFPPGSPFFFGYTLTAMLTALIYALFLFRARVSIVRVFVCKLLINYGVNVLLGSIWRTMLYGKGYWFYVSSSLIKNTVLLPIEVLLIVLLFRLLLPPMEHMGLTPPQPSRNIPFLAFKRKVQ